MINKSIWEANLNGVFLIISILVFCFYHQDLYSQQIVNIQTGHIYQSLQAAIDAPQTADGHILIASPGIFEENVIINKAINLRGSGQDSTVLSALNPNSNCITVTANIVKLSNLTIRNSMGQNCSGIFLNNVSNVVIDSCSILYNFRGIQLYSSSNNIISNSYISLNKENGIYLSASSLNNKIVNNVISYTAGGVGEWTGNGINTGDQLSSGTTILNNRIYNNYNCGIIGYAGSNTMQIQKNHIYNNKIGIQIGWSRNCIIENNTIRNNAEIGILFDTAPNNVVTNNKILLNAEGISLWGLGQSGISIERNLISNGFYGIYIGSATRNNTFKYNTISSCSTGIRININPNYANFGNRIYNNNFLNNSIHAEDFSPEQDFWDNGLPEGGNHWDDWTSPDYNNDGFVDNPYFVNGGYSQDNYPLVNPYGLTYSDTLEFSDQFLIKMDGYRPDIAFDKKNSVIYIVYESWRGIYPEIFLTSSRDSGKTFASAHPVTNQTQGFIEAPVIALDSSGNIHIVYRDAGYYISYCKSTDGGSTFSAPVRISDFPSSSIDRPSIACFGNNVYVAWRYDNSGYRIYFDKSINGSPFGTDKQINDVTIGSRGYPAISTGYNGMIYLTWVDNDKIRFAKSSNQGNDFSPSIRVDDNETVYPCKYPAITTTENENIFIAWEDYRNIYSHIRYSKSTDFGTTFENSKSVSDSIGNFHQNNPKIISNGNIIHAVWQDNRNNSNNPDIFYSFLANNSTSFSRNLKVNSSNGKINYGHKVPSVSFGSNLIFVTWQGSAENISGWQIYFSKAQFIHLPPLKVDENIKSPLNNFVLYQNYPNPFNAITNIKYYINSYSHVTLKIYDVLGQELSTLINQEQPEGNYVVSFEPKNLPSGIYFYKLQTGNSYMVRKMILLR